MLVRGGFGTPRKRQAWRRGGALALVAGVLVAGCTSANGAGSNGSSNGGGEPSKSEEAPAPKAVSLALTPKNKAKDIAPGEPVTVQANGGTLSSVKLVNAEGKKVKGKMRPDDTSWSSAEPLGYGKEYTLTARGVGEDGKAATKRAKFVTVQPAGTIGVETQIQDGTTVGVGMPVSFQFTSPVPDRKAAEKALKITPSKPTEGAFYWFNDSWVVWRPKTYWEPGTTVKVDANIYGKDFGGGLYGGDDLHEKMKIGKKLVAYADGETHRMIVYVNEKRIKNMPLAMGRPGHNTPKGTYTVMSEHTGYTMDSSTYGVPIDAAEGYRITVDTAVRLSNSGIFYHSAPWSVGQQGHDNVSHGCINLSPENASWLMGQTKPGDIVKVRNSGGPELEPTDGWSFWQIPWKEWRKGGPEN